MRPKWLWELLMILMSFLILELVMLSCTHGCLEQERSALLHLQTFFQSNPTFSNWTEEVDLNCCRWDGVECSNITTGRVTKLSLRIHRLADWYLNASLFLPFEELRSLDLSQNAILGFVENEGFGKLSKLRHLEVLDLSYNYFNDSTLSSLTNISSLKSLSLASDFEGTGQNPKNGDDFKWLSRLSGLETLDLSGKKLTNSFLLHLNGLSSLRSLILSNNELKGKVHIQDFYNLTNLKKLDLSNNQIESLRQSSNGSGRQARLINLEEIDLSNNLFNNNAIAHLNGFSNLKNLNIAFNKLKGSIDMKEFCALSNLERLDMSYNDLDQFVTSKENKCSMRKLKFLKLDGVSTKQSTFLGSLLQAFPNVKTLVLRFNSFLNETMVAQDQLNMLSNVENLILDYTPLNINILQRIGNFTSLKTLSMCNCGLAGTLPSQGWCDLKSLQELSLKGNALRGEIGSCFGNLTSLRYLDISNNQFSGNVASTPLANLTMLRFLSLSNNHFQVPSSFKPFSNYSDLQFLLIHGNKLVVEPEVHTTWSPKFQLKIFSLSNCTIEEQGNLQLPNFLYYQYDLRYVDLSYINFGGIMFPHWLLENNTRLEAFYMANSSIMGPFFLPSHPISDLWEFDISNNEMQHQIPTNVCSVFPSLKALLMSRNKFKSEIPVCLGQMRSLTHLDMSYNYLFGGIPEELAMSRSFVSLRLSNNSLSGNMFPTMYRSFYLQTLFLDGNNFSGEMPHFSPFISIYLSYLDLSDNHLSGKLPRWLWNHTELEILALSNNRFEGPLPMELCDLVNLHFLDLSGNLLSGFIPSCFSNLPNIQHVHLGNNRLSGPLVHAFYNSSSLVTLDLSENNLTGKITNWVDSLPALSVLLLNANHFHGEIPLGLCKLFLLSIVNLSHNKLSGSIPSCLSNLTLKPRSEKADIKLIYGGYEEFFDSWGVVENSGLTIYDLIDMTEYTGYDFLDSHGHPPSYAEEMIDFSTKNASRPYKGYILASLSGIDLSCNQLTGVIPPGLGNLSEIRALNLSHNNLTGSISSTFSKLKQIESLDLSYNNLNGTIPPQLTELTALAVFSVAHNNLSGPLPDQKAQFGTFDASSYEGNPLLCGPPLENSCGEGGLPEIPSPSFGEQGKEEDGFMDLDIFYISFVVSYGIMLLGTAIVLFLNPYWRRAWFFFVEKCSTDCYHFILDSLHRLPWLRRNNVGLSLMYLPWFKTSRSRSASIP